MDYQEMTLSKFNKIQQQKRNIALKMIDYLFPKKGLPEGVTLPSNFADLKKHKHPWL